MDALLATLWVQCTAIRGLGRPLSVCEPCLGLGALSELSRIGDFDVDSDAYELDGALAPFYFHMGMHVKVGKRDGDMLQINVHNLAPSEGACSGPPCQHVNQSGERLGAADARSEIFETFTTWLIELAWSGSLVWFALENSANIEHVHISETESYADAFMSKLLVAMPFFHIDSTSLGVFVFAILCIICSCV